METKPKGGTGEDVARNLETQFAVPIGNWRDRYAPDDLPELEGEVLDLEAQLDTHWPGWRKRQPFNKLTKDKIRYVKARLKRMDLILQGRAAWGMRLVDTKTGPMAVPVKPPPAGIEPTHAAYRPVVTETMLAVQLGMPLDVVRQGLAEMPHHRRDVRRWLQEFGRGREQAGVNPFPRSDAPPAPLLAGEA